MYSAGMAKQLALSNGGFAIVDDEKFDYLMQWTWRRGSRGYVVRSRLKGDGPGPHVILMHRVLLDVPDGMLTDHVNRDKLDNRIANLRICTQSENGFNKAALVQAISKYKGVSWFAPRGLWVAKVQKGGDVVYLQYFKDEKEAALAYDYAARIHHGEFASVNFPHVLDYVPAAPKPKGPKETRYRGVSRNGYRWMARARFAGKDYHLGTFATQELAAQAYDRFVIERLGPDATVNFPNTYSKAV